jgi:UDP-N-acetylmuramoylalanine--D-glutamate ligase
MNVAIIGYGLEGKAALAYYKNLGDHITVCDQDKAKAKEIPDDVASQLGQEYLHDLSRFDVIVRSAGINPGLITKGNPDAQAKITTVVNEFLRVSPTKHIIGVTGTKGKGTTSTLIAMMLHAAGQEAYLGGNIGLVPLEFLPKLTQTSWVVLELSSFQLIDLKKSPATAICLMVMPEHLNWHADMDDYMLAKAQLFKHQSTSDTAIYCAANDASRKIANYSPGSKIPYFAEPGAHVINNEVVIDGNTVCATNDIKLLGEHNWQNVCAAITAVWPITPDIQAMRSVLTTFSGLPHRLELVREVNDVTYYDDSFGTTPETAIVAIQAFNQPKIIILGGSDKGASYDELARVVATGNVRHALLIGDQAPRLLTALNQAGFTNFSSGGNSMSEVVANATQMAQPGDTVLLSPACASFDMFKDYKDRGDQFKQAVNALRVAD